MSLVFKLLSNLKIEVNRWNLNVSYCPFQSWNVIEGITLELDLVGSQLSVTCPFENYLRVFLVKDSECKSRHVENF